MAAIARSIKRVMQRAHDFRRFDIHRILIFEDALFLTEDETEILYALGQFVQLEGQRRVGVGFKIVEFEILEIREQDIAWQLVVTQAFKV